MAKEKPIYIDSKQAAKRLKVSVRRVQQYVDDGRLPAVMMGGVLLILPADIAKVERKKRGPKPKGKR